MSTEKGPQGQEIIPVEAQQPIVDFLKLLAGIALDSSPGSLQAARFIGQGILKSLEDKPEAQQILLAQIERAKTRLADS